MLISVSLFLLSFPATVQPQSPAVLERAFPLLTFSSPVDFQSAQDGSNRIFVVEQAGIIRVFLNSDATSSARVFLDISGLVSSGGETGLLGLAFHPMYELNGYFFVHYTRSTDSLRSIIARFTVTSNPDSASASSQLILLQVTQPYSNHNGGQLSFGPDGFLYIALGDGGSGGDPQNNAQNRSVLLGKILRIDVDAPQGGKNYGIPPTNPFKDNQSGFCEEIFAYGLRNPWRFSFDSPTGILWSGDVGQGAREEIDQIESGKNYGWRIMEGNICYNPPSGCDTTGLTLPVWDYGRSQGGSITGGYVYRGQAIANLYGRYVYGDFVSGRIWSLEYSGPGTAATMLLDSLGAYQLSTFGADEHGELYACSIAGTIHRFVPRQTTLARGEEAPQGSFHLFQNFPNPFNASTVIEYELPFAGNVQLEVFDPMGRSLMKPGAAWQDAGIHSMRWNAQGLASGLVFCRLTLSGREGIFAKTIPMLLLK